MERHKVSPQMKPWTLSASEALACFKSTPLGLSEAEARQRLERHGPNCLKEKPPRPTWMKFIDQFKNLLVIMLIVAAALAGAIGDLKDAVVILIVVVFNACLGFYQEHRADATLAALKKIQLKPEEVTVVNISGRGDKDMETYLKHFESLP